MGIDIPCRKGQFGVVWLIEKHYESAVVYAAKGIIQCC